MPALIENTSLETIFDLKVLLGLEAPTHPVVGIIQFFILPAWLLIGGSLLVILTISGYIGFWFNCYMIVAAWEAWGWVDSNFYDDIVKWFFVEIDSNYIIGFMVYPVKELIGTFLELEDNKKFTPMNEWQAYFFCLLVYPYIYFIALSTSLTQMTLIPYMMFWYLVDPNIFVVGKREDGTNIPNDNYAEIYAEADAVQAMLFFDLRYLYKGKQAYTIDFGNMCIHWLLAFLLLTTAWLIWYPMVIWLGISAF